ncbi:hypothetical protein HY229_07875 [Candidatus Acetothermia bacterium]|nr:hypothetical protein [Candidatus Acetothermia bacterium]MBI3643997.1 hypothetical protein [Candidatus Acetothermia bacterium]
MKKVVALVVLSFLFLSIGLLATVWASVVSTSGDIVQVAAPSSVQEGAMESNTTLKLFPEAKSLTLSQNVLVNLTGTGTFQNLTCIPTGTLLANSIVDSYFFHSDPVGVLTDGGVSYTGAVTFDHDVIGLLVTDKTLDASDSILGAPGVSYPKDDFRGLEVVANNDRATIATDRRTLQLELHTFNKVDEVRVITLVSGPGIQAGNNGCGGTNTGTTGNGNDNNNNNNNGGNDNNGNNNSGGSTQTGNNCAGLKNSYIDIVPGNRDNTIHLDGTGNTPVAIFSREDFDAPDCIDVASLTFGHSGTEMSLVGCGGKDVNNDGFIDLQCDFVTVDTQFVVGDAEGILKGKTVKSTAFQFQDKVTVFAVRRGTRICSINGITTLQIGRALYFIAQGTGIERSRVQIFNLLGQSIYDSGFVSGSQLRRNPMITLGRPLANGIYFYVVTTAGVNGVTSASGKMFIMR